VSDLEVVLWSLSWSAVSRLTLRFSGARFHPALASPFNYRHSQPSPLQSACSARPFASGQPGATFGTFFGPSKAAVIVNRSSASIAELGSVYVQEGSQHHHRNNNNVRTTRSVEQGNEEQEQESHKNIKPREYQPFESGIPVNEE
jgi:hypothetical protein